MRVNIWGYSETGKLILYFLISYKQGEIMEELNGPPKIFDNSHEKNADAEGLHLESLGGSLKKWREAALGSCSGLRP